MKSTLASLLRWLPFRAQEGSAAPRSVMVLVVVLVGLVGLGAAAQKKDARGAKSPKGSKVATSKRHTMTNLPLDHHRSDL